jgi:hypothetical protein
LLFSNNGNDGDTDGNGNGNLNLSTFDLHSNAANLSTSKIGFRFQNLRVMINTKRSAVESNPARKENLLGPQLEPPWTGYAGLMR